MAPDRPHHPGETSVTHLDDYQWPTCNTCPRDMRRDELDRLNCRICQHRADDNLAALPGLHEALEHALAPRRQSDGPHVTGSRTAPIPVRLDALNLLAVGGILTTLQEWQTDWHDQLGWTQPSWNGDQKQQLDQTVHALRTNLDWAASSHPAFPDFSREIAALVRSSRQQIDGTPPERRIAVTCPCGGTIRVTISTPGARCPACSHQYGRADVLELPLAVRNAA